MLYADCCIYPCRISIAWRTLEVKLYPQDVIRKDVYCYIHTIGCIGMAIEIKGNAILQTIGSDVDVLSLKKSYVVTF